MPRWSLCVENDEEVVLCSHGGSGAQNGAVLCLRDAQFSLKIFGQNISKEDHGLASVPG